MDPLQQTAFCILAAGKGTRLGELTESVNKALLPIDNKAVISYIIEKVPEECEIVVAVGYDKEKVEEYCLAAHTDRRFQFVDVDKLDGPGSGPGYSLLCCEPHLHCPFYLCNVDTIIKEGKYPDLSRNWLGTAWVSDARAFATVEYHVANGCIVTLKDKGEAESGDAYIGLAGIRDWTLFWEKLHLAFEEKPEFQYIDAFKSCWACISPAYMLTKHGFGWLDTGSLEGYKVACAHYGGEKLLGLEKNINEITYKVGDRLIKLCWDAEKNRKRLARAEQLKEFTPNVYFHGKYVMAYLWEKGQTLYDVRDLRLWTNFLDSCNANLWQSLEYQGSFEAVCNSFYHDKTWDRLKLFMQSKGWDMPPRLYINGVQCEPMDMCLVSLPWNRLQQGMPTRIHGDLQFDNALLNEVGQFKLIDWRECFGESTECGDIYYDLAKIYSGLDIPYDKLKAKEFTINSPGYQGMFIDYEFQVSSHLNSFRITFENWLKQRSLDLTKVRILAALIHLNMAPLHPAPIGDLLYYHANLRLTQLIAEGI